MTLTPGDRLTCGCYLKWAFEPANLTALRSPVSEVRPVTHNFQLNFSDERYADLIIIIGGKKIHTSKLLMSVQSTVLNNIILEKCSIDEETREENDKINKEFDQEAKKIDKKNYRN